MADKKNNKKENLNFEDKMDKGREMESQVNSLLHFKKPRAAKKVFSENWEEVLPKMPIRFTVALEDVEVEEVKPLMRGESLENVLEIINSLEIKLASKIDPRNPTRVAAYFQEKTGAKRKIIGFIPEEEINFLREFGPSRKMYKIKFNSVSQLDTNKPQVIIEFIRPELHICSSCGKEHFDSTINCADCRAKRKRLQSSIDEVKERPVIIPVAGAFQKIQEDTYIKSGELEKISKKDKQDNANSKK